MDTLTVASKASERYILGAHTLGLTVDAIIEDLYTHGHEHVTKDTIGDILKNNGQLPKLTYLWQNWIAKATNGLIPMGIYPWNSWSSRFILNCKTNKETNSTIFANMRKRGSDIPGENWIKVVLDEHRFIENGLARGRDIHDDATLQKIIVMAHNWGYTVPEITREIFGSTNRSTSAVTDMVRMTLKSNGIPGAEHRNGRKFGHVAQEFVVSAYKLGMDVKSIQDRMYVHGFDHPDQKKPILDLLERKGIWHGQKLERARPSQAAQPTQRRARDDVRPEEGQIASRRSQANEEPGKKIYIRDLLN